MGLVDGVLSFNSLLEATCRERLSNLCVGLDPNTEKLLALLDKKPEEDDPIDDEFCLAAMFTAASAVAPYVAALKPNAAFFEAIENEMPLMGAVGRYLSDNFPEVISICDAKRGDIGNTSAHYAYAVFNNQEFHAITVNPLMGEDAVAPFAENPKHGVFLLCLTSNPGADDFLLQNDLYLRIAEKAVQWNKNDNIGLVVGATRPEYLARIREIAPDLPLLIPGVGAQGGNLTETLDAINARENRRFLINASRSILYPSGVTWESYADSVGGAAKSLRDEIQRNLS